MKTLSTFITLSFLFFSCTKENNSNNGSNNSISSPFTVKYEIISTSNLATSPAQTKFITYTNSTGQAETTSSFTTSKTWTKTLTVNTTQRPLTLKLETPNALFFTSVGTLTGYIYINDILKAKSENQITKFQTSFIGNIPTMNYLIQ